jgi:nucleotide-binding universal stress UspA family protein
MFKHILIPTDGSDRSREAVAAAVQLAQALAAKVTAYHAIEAAEVRGVGDEAFIPTSAIKPLEGRLRERAEGFLAQAQRTAQAAGVACQTLITNPSTPDQGIIDAAKDKGCDVIFMASDRRGDLASLLQGSITHKVLAHSKIPVVVFR